MKIRNLGILSISIFSFLLVALSFLINACSSTPTSPAATATPGPVATATFTDTPCQNQSPTPSPCTHTFTPSATNSPTNSPTSTPSSTATVTPTKTPSNSPTNSPTATPTDTPCTCTMTPSATDSPTNSPSNTPTITPTHSPTNTATLSPVYTATLCPTQSFTPTPGLNGFSISGTVSYTGTGTVSASHPLQVVAFQPSNGGNGSYYLATSSGSSYTLQGLVNGNVYSVVAFYNPSATGLNWPPVVGSYAGLYGSSSCDLSIATPVTVTGNMTGRDITFDTTNVLNGFGGTVSYSGSHGRVDGCNGIMVAAYPAGTGIGGVGAAFSSNNSYTNTNGGSYSLVGGKGGGSACAAATADLLAFFDAAGTGNIQTGDPYIFLNSQSSSSTPNINFNITDANIY